MLLTTEQFETVVHTLAPARTPATAEGSDNGGQRRSPRVPVCTRLTLIPFAAGAEGLAGYDFPVDRNGTLRMPLADPLSAPIRDLSQGGIRFMMPRRLALDTPFVLLLPAPAISASSSIPLLAVECTVSYWQPIRRDLFAIGARFLRALPSFQMPQTPASIILPELDAMEASERLPLRAAV